MPQKRRSNQVRIDLLLVEKGIVDSRAKAQALVMAGHVYVNTQRVDKPSMTFCLDVPLEVKGLQKYVSRGGYKLEGALDELGVAVGGLVCVDVGASTGGFTDCLLQRGASKIYAVDVGHGLLAHKLLLDNRVHPMDKTNARHLTAEDFGEPVDIVVVDASFIGMEQLSDALARVVRPGGQVLAMIKPQFEVGRAIARKTKGVIHDPEVRRAAIASATQALERAGLVALRGCDSKTPGPKGNVEYFLLVHKSA